MTDDGHVYEDPDGLRVLIKPSADHSPGAFLLPLDASEAAPGVAVPAHRLAEFTGAMYQAAGQPIPELPQIFDPAVVRALDADMHYALHGTSGTGYEGAARSLLAHGWRHHGHAEIAGPPA